MTPAIRRISDTVIQQSQTWYYLAQNAVLSATFQRLPNDTTSTGPLDATDSYATAAASFADAAGRTTGNVDYGREDVGANAAWTHYVFDGTTGDLVDTDSDGIPDVVQNGLPEPYDGTNGSAAGIDFQLNLTEYNAAGQAYRTIDNIGRINETQFDLLGRTVRTIQNYDDGVADETDTDRDSTTAYQYDSSGRMVTLIAYNAKGTGNGVEEQKTKYLYASPVNASWQTAAVYPDSTDVLSQDSNNDWSITTDNGDHTSTAYDLAGRTTGMTDERGVVHAYSFDSAGRLAADTVTSLGTSGIVDGSVRRIGRAYDDMGRVQNVTSYDAATGGTVVNDVQYAFDGWGSVLREWQSHTGAVDTGTTPSVQYTYDDGAVSGVAKYNRLAAVTYPNGRDVSYGYGTAGAVDDIMSRLGTIGDSGGTLAAYKYLGAGTIAVEDYVASQTKLTYLDSGGNVVWLDRFGRVADQVWEHYYLDGSGNEITDGTPDAYAYGYNRAGNRVWKENLAAGSQTPAVDLDELYAYNGLDELVGTQRGDLNGTHDAILSGTQSFSQGWDLDGLGNWSGFDDNGTAQTRTANAANEMTSASGWATPAHDAAGNMTTIPSPQSGNASHAIQATYDAWNHLAEVTDGGIVVAKYAYDGTGRRILQIVDSQSPLAPDSLDASIDYYHNGQQVVETREGGLISGVPAAPETLNPTHQFIWSQRYIDALVCRDDLSGGIIQPASRLFYLSDANYNVTALLGNVSGAWQAVERYVYAPYGKPTIYTPDWSIIRAVSIYGNTTLYTGREFDPATGLMYYRARYYSTDLGRFVGRDPIGADCDLYRYVLDSPLEERDPFGLAASAKVEYFEKFGEGLKAKFVVFVLDKCEQLCVHVHVRRFLEQFGDPEKYRLKWNHWCEHEPEFGWRGLVWSKDHKWAMPNLALFLDGTDATNHYGGDYGIPAKYDENGDLVPGTGGDFYHEDDDYMILRVTTFLDTGEAFGEDETYAWHPIRGTRDEEAVVHVAGSDMVCVKRPKSGSAKIELRYADHDRDYGTVTIPLDFGKGGTGLGQPAIEP